MSHTTQPNNKSLNHTITVALDYDPVRERQLISLQNKPNHPDKHIAKYDCSTNPIMICSTPTGIRWIYDNLVVLGNELDKEGKDFERNIAHKAAEIIYQKVKEDIKIDCRLPASKHPSNTD